MKLSSPKCRTKLRWWQLFIYNRNKINEREIRLEINANIIGKATVA